MSDGLEIILASGSPRRRELLEQMGQTFRVIAPDVDETVSGTPAEMTDALSERKARAVCAGLTEGVVLAADTLVAVDGEALGKPADHADALRMLKLLSGRAHEVITGVCLIDAASGRMCKRVERTKVHFKELSESQMRDYVQSGEPMDKAGAYGIQGGAGAFVERIEGSYENVMGLPVQALAPMLSELTGSEKPSE